jgi:CheY-like chemotaxis protein
MSTSPPDLPPAPTTPAASERFTRRALVVDEDTMALRVCREVVEKAGFAVEAVDSGVAAVISARDRRPEFIFIAPQLRDVPGSKAVEWLRANPALRAIPIVVLPKPVTAGAIRQCIHDVLASQKAR